MRGKKWCGEVPVLGKPAEQYLFHWRKSYLPGEFICIRDCGRIFLRKPLVNISAAQECFFPVTNVTPSATELLVPTAWPFLLKGHHRSSVFAVGISGEERHVDVSCAAVACPVGEEFAVRKQAS